MTKDITIADALNGVNFEIKTLSGKAINVKS